MNWPFGKSRKWQIHHRRMPFFSVFLLIQINEPKCLLSLNDLGKQMILRRTGLVIVFNIGDIFISDREVISKEVVVCPLFSWKACLLSHSKNNVLINPRTTPYLCKLWHTTLFYFLTHLNFVSHAWFFVISVSIRLFLQPLLNVNLANDRNNYI